MVTHKSSTSAACLLVSLVAVLAGCSQSQTDEEALLPPKIHGLPLIDSRSGEEAAGMIGQAHGQNVAPEESHIGLYGAQGIKAVLYLSRFATAAQADSQVAAMAARLAAGSPGYGHVAQFQVGGTLVHTAAGEGQVHYFFARGARLTWLAAPPGLARAALAELLGVPVDSIKQVSESESEGVSE